MTEREAWVTLATNDDYAVGAMVLAKSLELAGTTRRKAILITEGVTKYRKQLEDAFDDVYVVESILCASSSELVRCTGRSELAESLTKLRVWQLEQYDKCVYVDADMLAVSNCDDLFDRDELSAAPDIGWPDCFNSGLMVVKPSAKTFDKLMEFSKSTPSFDGADQGLLNSYFNDWSTGDSAKRIPFTYNMTAHRPTAADLYNRYGYQPAIIHFRKDVKLVHFIGPLKPWHRSPTATATTDDTELNFHRQWCDVHNQIDLDQPCCRLVEQSEATEYRDSSRRQWQDEGRPDFAGSDSTDNILRRIRNNL